MKVPDEAAIEEARVAREELAAVQKKLEASSKLEIKLKKELQEERDREELARLYDQGKNRKKKERLEWMYAAGPTQSQDFIDQEKEDYLLGKKKIGSSSFKTAEEDSSVAVAPLPTVSSMYGPSANTTRDFQAKVRDDPLMAFKRQEQASLQAVLKNPLKVSKLKDGKKSKKSKQAAKQTMVSESSKSSRSKAGPASKQSKSKSGAVSRPAGSKI